MFKLRIPMAIIVSSGGLLMLAVGSFLLISSVVQSSESQTFDKQAKLTSRDDGQLATAEAPPEKLSSKASRGRSGRFFNQDAKSQSDVQQQQQDRSLSMESYAAALAAANSGDQSNGSADLVQTTIPATDAASFGEQPASVSASAGRQFEATEYSPVHTAAGSYYGAGASSSAASTYVPSHLSNQLAGGNHHHHHHSHSGGPSYANYHQHYQSGLSSYSPHHGAASKKVATSLAPPLGYPSHDYWSAPSHFADRSGVFSPTTHYWSGPHGSNSGGLGTSLMSSASSALSHWTGGFGIAEIVCGIVALSIGAVILGAPFFLIYLALMGNFSGSSTLSLSNPMQGGATTGAPGGAGTTTVNGRRKRLAIFEPATLKVALANGDLSETQEQFNVLADAIVSQLSPFVDFQQVTSTFRRLISSIEKYSKLNKGTSIRSEATRAVVHDNRKKDKSSQLL